MKTFASIACRVFTIATLFVVLPSSAFAQSAKAKHSTPPAPVIEEEVCVVEGEQGLCKIKKPDAAATWHDARKMLYFMCQLSHNDPATKPKFTGRCVNKFVEGVAFVTTPNSASTHWRQKWVAEFTQGMPAQYAVAYSESAISAYTPPHKDQKSELTSEWLCLNKPSYDMRTEGIDCQAVRRALGDKVLSDEVHQAVLAGTFNPTVAALGEPQDDLKSVGGMAINPQFAREQAAKKQAEEQRQRQADAAAATERQRLAKEKEAKDAKDYKALTDALIQLQQTMQRR